MSESNHSHHGPNSLVWGARPCAEQDHEYRLNPDLISYEELLCQLDRNFKDISRRLGNQTSVTEPDLSFEEQWTGRWDRTDPDGVARKIYVKTIDCGSMPNDSHKDVPHNIVNLRSILNINGFMRSVQPPYFHNRVFPFAAVNSMISVDVVRVAEILQFQCRGDYSLYTIWRATLEYTKNE
ncbi:hypothetical protein C4J81_03495 [Deltaproteobacteria bacterium Smac51]|nr:hypothetical protein C4J81_03495 [Deltaproteobacteria bacterium Smac51]